jgi:hypothetical protein
MAIPRSHVEEHLSRAYVMAVVARAGATFTPTSSDYGIDGYIQGVTELSNGKCASTGHPIQCQLKATTTCGLTNDDVLYDMDVAAYNKLARCEDPSLCLLVLLRLPERYEEWLTLSEDELVLKNCCYWHHITGRPSANAASQRIKVPRTQLFTPAAVVELLNHAGRGEI